MSELDEKVHKPLRHLLILGASSHLMLGRIKRAVAELFRPHSQHDSDVQIFELKDLPSGVVSLLNATGGVTAFVPLSTRSLTHHTPRDTRRGNRDEASSRMHPYRQAKSLSNDRARAKHGVAAPSSTKSKHRPKVPGPTVEPVSSTAEWDGWPDGSLGFNHTRRSRGGSADANTWQLGKMTRRQCQGVIKCDNEDCMIIVRPQSRPSGIKGQLSKQCACGADLHHQACKVISILHTFSSGVHYQKGGVHLHPRPTARLHMLRAEHKRLAEIVNEHPKTGPLRLVVGHSVSAISLVLTNAERVKYERKNILKASGSYGKNFVEEFAKFETSHRDFIRTSQFGAVFAVVMQTPFMSACLLKAAIEQEAVNGIVSDGAHRFWAQRNSILFISSTYEPTQLQCWVPGLISFLNGSSAEHFRVHFFQLFLSIAEECDRRSLELTDELLANVMDFSAAQRAGFILAYIDFWRFRDPSGRGIAALQARSEELLKGCAQHFRSQVTRVKKISGVVHPSQIDVFENYARQLLNCNTVEEFNSCASRFIIDFPKAEKWIRWWMLPAHASMLFPAARTMSPELWDSIPDTSNAEEAMHWKMYAAYYESQSNAKKRKHSFAILGLQLKVSDGVKIHYGEDRQYWKRTAEVHGRTKLSHLPGSGKRTKNDGRPPDTAASRDYGTSMEPMFVGLADDHPLRHLQQLIQTRNSTDLAQYEPGGSKVLRAQRNGFRKLLFDLPTTVVASMHDFGTPFGWLDDITSHVVPAGHDKMSSGLERALSYFRLTAVSLRKCSGSITGEQYQLGKIRYRSPCTLSSTLCHQYDGNITKWFLEFMRVTQPVPLTSCWRSVDGIQLCDGQAVLFDIILNIPIALILHVDSATGSTESDAENIWNIPKSLSPLGKNSDATSRGVKYNIASHVYLSAASSHFIVRYCSSDAGKPRIFDYDGNKHDGHAVFRSSTGLLGALTGPSDLLSDIPRGYTLHKIAYHLAGGEDAQKYFRTQQISQARSLGVHFVVNGSSETGIPSPCDVRLPGISRVDGLDRYWLAPGTSAIDCNLPLPDKSPRKRPKLPTMPVTRSESQPKAKLSLSLPPITAMSPSKLAPHPTAVPDADASDLGIDLDYACRCQTLSHIACQRNGRASNSKAQAEFRCDFCIGPLGLKQIPKKNRRKGADPIPKLSLQKRLDAGKGSLARHGNYWYPVRLVMKAKSGWTVAWWRGNEYDDPSPPPTLVFLKKLITSKLGKWVHASEIVPADDLLSDFRHVPYTDEIDTVLRPHLAQLQRLYDDPSGAHPNIPAVQVALRNLSAKGPGSEALRAGGISSTGELEMIDCARAANWFYRNIVGAAHSAVQWFGRALLPHAYTILIAHLNHESIQDVMNDDPDYAQMDREAAAFQIAWEFQVSRSRVSYTDVDREFLGYFEERLFEHSQETGQAGNCQWGLDAGPHQGGWNPYGDIPSHWNHDESDSELELGPDYIHPHVEHKSPKPVPAPLTARPVPRPIKRQRDKEEHAVDDDDLAEEQKLAKHGKSGKKWEPKPIPAELAALALLGGTVTKTAASDGGTPSMGGGSLSAVWRYLGSTSAAPWRHCGTLPLPVLIGKYVAIVSLPAAQGAILPPQPQATLLFGRRILSPGTGGEGVPESNYPPGSCKLGGSTGCGTDARAAVCRLGGSAWAARPIPAPPYVVQTRDWGAVRELEGGSVRAAGPTPVPPCRLNACVQTRDRGALHELEGGSAQAAGPMPVLSCVVQTRDRTVCPSAGSGCRPRARGWERAGCRTDTHATVCRPNTGSRDQV
ncbi:hypothetical protein DFH08DRAFT_822304 [Mycena albidolilacea]|uniref:Uncharacterized protein n=1 Tax=Mycena albidolilacea TaxID=1033008 RepID=A0AAD6Z8P9_9AGAR|nr:hypothetical protein DFH08DRAFT_822304 [Mycena albidolilacea]